MKKEGPRRQRAGATKLTLRKKGGIHAVPFRTMGG